MERLRKRLNIFLAFVFCLFFLSDQVIAEQIIIGRITSVDQQGNVVIEIPDGPVPAIGDMVTISESAFGGIAAYYLGEWFVAAMDKNQVHAQIKKLAGQDLPKVGGSAHVYIADRHNNAGQKEFMDKEQFSNKGEDQDGFQEL